MNYRARDKKSYEGLSSQRQDARVLAEQERMAPPDLAGGAMEDGGALATGVDEGCSCPGHRHNTLDCDPLDLAVQPYGCHPQNNFLWFFIIVVRFNSRSGAMAIVELSCGRAARAQCDSWGL